MQLMVMQTGLICLREKLFKEGKVATHLIKPQSFFATKCLDELAVYF